MTSLPVFKGIAVTTDFSAARSRSHHNHHDRDVLQFQLPEQGTQWQWQWKSDTVIHSPVPLSFRRLRNITRILSGGIAVKIQLKMVYDRKLSKASMFNGDPKSGSNPPCHGHSNKARQTADPPLKALGGRRPAPIDRPPPARRPFHFTRVSLSDPVVKLSAQARSILIQVS